jgi:3-oxoadipate enol-lactonase
MPTIDFDDVTLHYADEGVGEPVVLIHGFPLSSDLWMPQRAALSARYRVISIDLRGHGRSDPAHGPATMDLFADDVVALLDRLGIGATNVAGLSMGGYIVMALLRRHPDRVRSIMLLATKAPGDTEAGKQARDEMIALAQSEGAGAVAEKMLPKMLTASTREGNSELVGFARAMMAGTSVEGIVGALHALRERPDSRATLQGLTLPALVLVGAEDELTPPSEATAMGDAMPNARLEIIPDASHLLNMEQPEPVNRAMLEFLDRLYSN